MSFPPPDPSRPARTELPPPDESPSAPPARPADSPTNPASPDDAAPEEPLSTDDATASERATVNAEPGPAGDASGNEEPASADATAATDELQPAGDTAPIGEDVVLTPDEIIDESNEPAADQPAAASNLPAAAPSRALVPIPQADDGDPPKPPQAGLSRRWSLPVWGWLAIAAVVIAAGVVAVVTRPDDDSKRVTALEEEVRAKDAELTQAQADAQQDAFDDVQEVRDEAEQQLSAAASAREQAEQAAEQADARYAAFLEAEIPRVQQESQTNACSESDAAGYAQAPKPDPSSFAQAEVAHLPADTAAAIIARLDMAAIAGQVDSCYQTGSDRYLSQTTTTTTLPAEPPPDPNAPPADGAAAPG